MLFRGFGFFYEVACGDRLVSFLPMSAFVLGNFYSEKFLQPQVGGNEPAGRGAFEAAVALAMGRLRHRVDALGAFVPAAVAGDAPLLVRFDEETSERAICAVETENSWHTGKGGTGSSALLWFERVREG